MIYAEQIDSRTDRLVHVLISDERDPRPAQHDLRPRGLHDLRQRRPDRHPAPARRHDPHQRRRRQRLPDRLRDVRRQPGPARERWRAACAKEDDPKELTLPAAAATAIDARRAAGTPSPRPSWSSCTASSPSRSPASSSAWSPCRSGIEPARAVRSRGFAVSLAVIFIYYILLSAGQGFAEQGTRARLARALAAQHRLRRARRRPRCARAARERALLGVRRRVSSGRCAACLVDPPARRSVAMTDRRRLLLPIARPPRRHRVPAHVRAHPAGLRRHLPARRLLRPLRHLPPARRVGERDRCASSSTASRSS